MVGSKRPRGSSSLGPLQPLLAKAQTDELIKLVEFDCRRDEVASTKCVINNLVLKFGGERINELVTITVAAHDLAKKHSDLRVVHEADPDVETTFRSLKVGLPTPSIIGSSTAEKEALNSWIRNEERAFHQKLVDKMLDSYSNAELRVKEEANASLQQAKVDLMIYLQEALQKLPRDEAELVISKANAWLEECVQNGLAVMRPNNSGTNEDVDMEEILCGQPPPPSPQPPNANAKDIDGGENTTAAEGVSSDEDPPPQPKAKAKGKGKKKVVLEQGNNEVDTSNPLAPPNTSSSLPPDLKSKMDALTFDMQEIKKMLPLLATALSTPPPHGGGGRGGRGRGGWHERGYNRGWGQGSGGQRWDNYQAPSSLWYPPSHVPFAAFYSPPPPPPSHKGKGNVEAPPHSTIFTP